MPRRLSAGSQAEGDHYDSRKRDRQKVFNQRLGQSPDSLSHSQVSARQFSPNRPCNDRRSFVSASGNGNASGKENSDPLVDLLHDFKQGLELPGMSLSNVHRVESGASQSESQTVDPMDELDDSAPARTVSHERYHAPAHPPTIQTDKSASLEIGLRTSSAASDELLTHCPVCELSMRGDASMLIYHLYFGFIAHGWHRRSIAGRKMACAG